MIRRFFISAVLALPLAFSGNIALAQNEVVDSVNDYLTGLVSATARFTQQSADGTVATGQFYLLKPGKMRFEYDPPSAALLIADGEVIAIFDKKSNRGPQRYPQSSTPLSLMSRNDIDVTTSKFVRLIVVESPSDGADEQILMTMYDPEAIGNGSIMMIFDMDPVALVKWVIVDGSGLESIVTLEPLDTETKLDTDLFHIVKNIKLMEAAREDN